jgi:hypothetical protein
VLKGRKSAEVDRLATDLKSRFAENGCPLPFAKKADFVYQLGTRKVTLNAVSSKLVGTLTQSQLRHNSDTTQTQLSGNSDTTQTQLRHNPDTTQWQLSLFLCLSLCVGVGGFVLCTQSEWAGATQTSWSSWRRRASKPTPKSSTTNLIYSNPNFTPRRCHTCSTPGSIAFAGQRPSDEAERSEQVDKWRDDATAAGCGGKRCREQGRTDDRCW